MELSCDTGRDRLLNAGNISGSFKYDAAGSRHLGKVSKIKNFLYSNTRRALELVSMLVNKVLRQSQRSTVLVVLR